MAENKTYGPGGNYEIEGLPFSKIVSITCKGIKIRLWRSMIVVSGIVLAIAFLSYILCADGFLKTAGKYARELEATSPETIKGAEKLMKRVKWVNSLKEKGVPLSAIAKYAEEVDNASTEELSNNQELKTKAELIGELRHEGIDPKEVAGFADDIANTPAAELDEAEILASRSTLIKALTKAGTEFDTASMENQRVQTYWMVGLALLISFVGIVNAMLMSVTERFREIGTMKCLGALDGFVMKMFLIESVIEGSVGALLGMIIGIILAYGEGATIYGLHVWSMLSPLWFLVAAVGSLIAGIVITVLGAVYPAREAAKMMPVVALRAEL